jgi:hypothetical protein
MTDRDECDIALNLNQERLKIGIFSLVISGSPGSLSIVGGRFVSFAQMRVDRYPAVSCHPGPQACNFSPVDSDAILRELENGGRQVLVTIGADGVFEFTEDASAYATLVNAIRQHGFIPPMSQRVGTAHRRS